VELLKLFGVKGHRIEPVAGTVLLKLSTEAYMNLLKDWPGGISYADTLLCVSSLRIWPGRAWEIFAGVS